jgi:hypothetical protein
MMSVPADLSSEPLYRLEPERASALALRNIPFDLSLCLEPVTQGMPMAASTFEIDLVSPPLDFIGRMRFFDDRLIRLFDVPANSWF